MIKSRLDLAVYSVAVGEDVSHYFLSRISGNISGLFPSNSDSLWHYIMKDLIRPQCNGKFGFHLSVSFISAKLCSVKFV